MRLDTFEQTFESSLDIENENFSDPITPFRDYSLESLKKLAVLLLKELEAIQTSFDSIQTIDLAEKKICLAKSVQQYEVRLIKSALIQTGWNQKRAAELLGIKNTTLNSKIKRYKINWKFGLMDAA